MVRREWAQKLFEQQYDKTNKMACGPSKDSDQPRRIISLGICPVWSKSSLCAQWKLSSCGQRRLWSDWADAQADLSLRWAYVILFWHGAAHFTTNLHESYVAGLGFKLLTWCAANCATGAAVTSITGVFCLPLFTTNNFLFIILMVMLYFCFLMQDIFPIWFQ